MLVGSWTWWHVPHEVKGLEAFECRKANDWVVLPTIFFKFTSKFGEDYDPTHIFQGGCAEKPTNTALRISVCLCSASGLCVLWRPLWYHASSSVEAQVFGEFPPKNSDFAAMNLGTPTKNQLLGEIIGRTAFRSP